MVDQGEVKQVLREEMDARGWHNDDWRAGLAAIIGGESGFVPKFETGYAHTSNARIRSIFPSRTASLSDAQLNQLKSTDESWFNFIYSADNATGRQLGNIDRQDGFRFRGGGLNQLTGRFNYARYGRLVGADLTTHPELINTPRVAAAVAVEYMKDRFKGGDFDAMKKAIGVSIGEPDDLKNQLYAKYTQTGEWKYEGTVVISSSVAYDPIVTVYNEAAENLQRFLQSRGLYTGRIDGDVGPATRAALRAYVAHSG